jgi:hypothetical protein
MSADPSFNPDAAYGSDRWLAHTLGRSYEWFRKARPKLEADGFPRKDRVVGYTLKADVEAWLGRRRVVPDCVKVQEPDSHHSKENLHEL